MTSSPAFADDLHEMKIGKQDILAITRCFVSFPLFTNVPVNKIIGDILAEKAFKDDWFNKEYDLDITKTEL